MQPGRECTSERPQPAASHRLSSSTPGDGATVDTLPQRVSLTFNEDIQPSFGALSVIGPDNTGYGSPVGGAAQWFASGDRGGVAIRPDLLSMHVRR
ncbi:copper resistance CopC family protein [Gordonia sp. NPDC003424]